MNRPADITIRTLDDVESYAAAHTAQTPITIGERTYLLVEKDVEYGIGGVLHLPVVTYRGWELTLTWPPI